MSTQHTPTPRYTCFSDSDRLDQQMLALDGKPIAHFFVAGFPHILTIVRACNAHEELLNACFGLAGILEEMGIELPAAAVSAMSFAKGSSYYPLANRRANK